MTTYSYQLEFDDAELITFELALKLLEETYNKEISMLDEHARAPYEWHLSNIKSFRARLYSNPQLRSSNNFWRRKSISGDKDQS